MTGTYEFPFHDEQVDRLLTLADEGAVPHRFVARDQPGQRWRATPTVAGPT